MSSPRIPVRLRRKIGRILRLSLSNLRSPRATFGRRCEIQRGLRLLLEGDGRVNVGERCVLDRGVVLQSAGELSIGDGSIVGHHSTIAAHDSVLIGDHCLIAEMVSIRDHDHEFGRLDLPVRFQGARSDPVRIGRDVWIGAKAVVLKGVTIGDHAIIGAGAVVTTDVPERGIALGVPATVRSFRSEE